MQKIMVEVYLPAARRAFDIFIPPDRKLYEITGLIAQSLSELTEGMFEASASTALCAREDGRIFNINLSARELGLANGSMLILI